MRVRGGLSTWLALLVIVVLVAGGAGLALDLHRAATPAEAAPATVLGWEPGVASDVPPLAPITVYFSQAMNRASVLHAWHMAPSAAGTFSWSGNALAFHPSRPLRSGTTYTLQIGSTARDAAGKPLAAPFTESFTAGDPMRVESVTPVTGTTGVPLNGLVAVTFNHPMVPLAGLGAPAQTPAGWRVTLSPRTPGHGSWLGTSTWVFHPARGLVPSSTYTVTVSGSARDAWGEPLGHDVRLSFRTITPAIVALAPRNGQRDANPSAPISITFNQPMDRASVANAFSLSAGGTQVRGSTGWDGTTFHFTPITPLDPSALYTATVAGSARAANENATLRTPATWTFHVASPPSVLSSTPTQGATEAQPYVELHFSAPMNVSSLDHRLTVRPAVAGMSTYASGPNGPGSSVYDVSGNFQPSTAYTVTIAAGARDLYGRTMATPFTLHFTTAPLQPSVTLYSPTGAGTGIVFSAGHAATAPVQLLNVSQVHYVLVRTTSTVIENPYAYGGALVPPAGTTIRTWTESVRSHLNQTDDEGVPLRNADASPLSPGIYWLGASAPSSSSTVPASAEMVVAADTAVTLKTAQGQALVWVTSTETGRPLAGVPVQLLGDRLHPFARAVTDTKGVATFTISPNASVQAALVTGGHTGMALNSWLAPSNTQYSPFDANGAYVAAPNGTYLYTDRPIYRPGQLVHFRGVVWRDLDGVYAHFRPITVRVSALDSHGKSLYGAALVPDRYGSIHGTFRIPQHAGTGQVYMTLQVPGTALADGNPGTYFSVANYRKPEFLTSVSTPRPWYAQGQTIDAVVDVRYVFGAPVAGQTVTWTAYSRDTFPTPAGMEPYQFGDQVAIQAAYTPQPNFGESQFGTQIGQGSGTTDDRGRLIIHLPVDLARDASDQQVTIEATTTDINHQSVSGRVQVNAYKAARLIGLAPQSSVVQPGQADRIDVAVVSPDGAPVPHASIVATMYRRTYTSALADGGFAGTYWKQIPHDRKVSSQSVGTDAKGRATVSFAPSQGGTYAVVVTAAGGHGGTARGSMLLYADQSAAVDWGTGSNGPITLQPDRVSYRVGQTAHILIASPFPNASALLTVERGSIRLHSVVHFTSTSPTVGVPITLSDLPNVYVTVTLFHGWRGSAPPAWRYGTTELHVNVDPRRLVVHLRQSSAHVHPGATVTYTVTTTNAQGKPLPAQLSLALVDTAVLALQDETNPDIVKALYGERPDGVLTNSSGTVSVDGLQSQPNFQIHPLGGGGGGGGGPGTTTIYRHFADTAYWSADVRTGAAGTATVRVQLPDNFTTWRLDARGVTADERVGGAHLLTVSSQDLVLRPMTPRFLVQGDTVRLGVAVNNNLSRRVRTRISLAARGVRPNGSTARTVVLPPHGERLILWSTVVGQQSGATLTFSAAPSTQGVQGYGYRIRVPVEPPLTDETVATAGQVFGAVRQGVVVPANAVRQPGQLLVQLSAALTAGMGTALSQLQPQPYESNDDTASRLLAAAALRTIPASASGLSPLAYQRTARVEAAAAAKLAASQNGDGGWPWFSGGSDPSDPTITADAVEALSRSHLQRAAMERGVAFLAGVLGKATPDDRAHLLLVLADAGHVDLASLEALNTDTVIRAHLSAAARADLAAGLLRAGDARAARSLMATLDASAKVSATGAHWEGQIQDGQTAVEATARVLAAMVRVTPHDPLIPAAARWLMLARSGTAWDTAHDTADALAALAPYAHAARAGATSYAYTVAVNGAAKRAGSFAPGATSTPSVTVPVAALRRGTANVIDIRRAPAGRTPERGTLYYVARLRYYLPAAAMPARNEGISISRRYLDHSGHVLHAAAAGSLVQVELTVTSGQTLRYLDIEDPIPAGFEPIDQSLQTSRQGLFAAWQPPQAAPGVANLSPYLDHTDLRDNSVSLDATSLPPGTYRYTYLAQATVAGHYDVAPTHAAEVFFPEVFGRSAGQTFVVR